MKRWAPIVALALLGGTVRAAPETQIHWVMGTYLRVTAEGGDVVPALRACFAEARRLDHVFSRFDATSELSRLHERRSQPMSRPFADLLDRSLVLGHRTGGAFDVTVGALTGVWRADAAPAPAVLAAARATIGGVTRTRTGVRIAPGTQLDFDGIAKGYAVDACVQHLRAAGVGRAFVSFGESSLYALGTLAVGSDWDVAVRGLDPDATVGTLHLRDQAVSVSATRNASGRRGTIVDPASGRALDDDRVAVIVATSATDAEAYSKALLVWGPAGLSRLERDGGVQALIVSENGAEQGPGMSAAAIFAPLSVPRPLQRAEDGLS